MQPALCSELRIIVFDAYNPRDLADETNLWLKSEGEAMEVIDWSYRMGVNSGQAEEHPAVHSMVLCCRKIGIKP